MNPQQEHTDNQQENEKLRLEIVQLKKSLEKEEFLHKTLYKQWNELNARTLAREREFRRFKTRNLLYKYAFYLILFSVASAYYFLGKGDETIAAASQTVSSPTPATNKALTTSRETVKTPDVKFQEKQVIKPDAIQPKLAAINKPAVDKPLADSVRSSVYWEGWSAYYEKSVNPYQKSPQKYEVWLAGWKEGENDAKKILRKISADTLNLLSGIRSEKPQN